MQALAGVQQELAEARSALAAAQANARPLTEKSGEQAQLLAGAEAGPVLGALSTSC